jgi:hypothetical protein
MVYSIVVEIYLYQEDIFWIGQPKLMIDFLGTKTEYAVLVRKSYWFLWYRDDVNIEKYKP